MRSPSGTYGKRTSARRCLVSAITFLGFLVLLYGLLCRAALADETSGEQPNEKVLAMLNDERTEAGLEALTPDKRIDDAAALHLAEFVKHGETSDQFDGEPSLLERLRMAQVPSAAAGEVMLKTPSLDQVPELLKRENIQKVLLNPAYSAVGVAEVQDGPALFIVANLARPLQALSPEEVENLVVESVQQSRLRANLTAFKIVPMPQLHGLACDMAKKDSLKVTAVDPYSGHINAPSDIHNFTFTAADPRTLPPSVENAGGDPKINSISVGVCFGRSKTYPDGTYWVAIMLYRTKVQVR
jgi:uncharacterized protein YkwD